MSSYTLDHKYGRSMHQQEQQGSSNIAIIIIFFNKTIILLALVGYEIVIANSLAITISYPARACGRIVKYTTRKRSITIFYSIKTHISILLAARRIS